MAGAEWLPVAREDAKLMGCEVVKMPGGGTAIVCSRGRKPKPRCACGRPSTKLCDGPKPNGKTCDEPLCNEHAVHHEPDTDYCPLCALDAPPVQGSLL